MVRIRVERNDVLERPTDLLVLKYAQHLYGADRAVVDAMRLGRRPGLPRAGGHLVISDTGGLPARRVMFLGVGELSDISYREIREFGKRAIVTTADRVPSARELCLTLHGVGFGLDESEAFRSEVAGLLVVASTMPPASRLEEVVFVERDPARAERLQRLLVEILPEATSEPISRNDAPTTSPSAREERFPIDRAGLDAETRAHAFVAMPFTEELHDLFHYAIAPPLRDAGMICERMDQLSFTGDVVTMMRRRISDARVVVAEISSANPNVYLEVGYAWASDRPTILLCHQAAEPKFDVRGHRFLRYGSMRELETKLAREVKALL